LEGLDLQKVSSKPRRWERFHSCRIEQSSMRRKKDQWEYELRLSFVAIVGTSRELFPLWEEEEPFSTLETAQGKGECGSLLLLVVVLCVLFS
jgi:hypothetical protein